jgi:hypothetical protein
VLVAQQWRAAGVVIAAGKCINGLRLTVLQARVMFSYQANKQKRDQQGALATAWWFEASALLQARTYQRPGNAKADSSRAATPAASWSAHLDKAHNALPVVARCSPRKLDPSVRHRPRPYYATRSRQRKHAARLCEELVLYRKVRVILQVQRLAWRAAAAHAAKGEDARAEAQLRGDCCPLAGEGQLVATLCHQCERLARERASDAGCKSYPQDGEFIGLKASPAWTVQAERFVQLARQNPACNTYVAGQQHSRWRACLY